MVALELGDLGLGPRVIAVALSRRDFAHVAGRVVRPHSDLDRVLYQCPQRAAQWVGGSGGASSGRKKFDHMLAPQKHNPLLTMLDAQPSNDATIGRLLAGPCRSERPAG